MKNIIDKTKSYNGLTPISELEPKITPNGTKFRQVLCKCEYCGETSIQDLSGLIRYKRQCSCQGNVNIVDDKIDKKLRNSWSHAKNRCNNPNDPRYLSYGFRGIKMCIEWENNFKLFKQWALENGFKEELTLDRIDVNDDYSPDNCRWVSQEVQQNNRTNNKYYTIKGETKTLAQHSKELGIEKSKLLYRIKHNWTDDRIVIP